MKIVSAASILKGNEELAAANADRLAAAGVFTVNVMGSPGAGKTTLLEALLPRLAGRGVAVIEGDLATTRDAERIEALRVPVVQVNTAGACHLDSAMVQAALRELDLGALRFLFIENVGNLVCPAGFRLGEHLRLVVLSTVEGDDKVAKYPPMFQRAGAVVLSKMDLAGLVEFDRTRVEADLRRLLPQGPVFPVCARRGEGVEELAAWLIAQREGRFGAASR